MEDIKEIFKLSQDGFPNYRATFAKIDTVFPIDGADKLVRAIICGRDVVITKDLPTDALYVYIPIESSLSHKYLSSNNLYRISESTYALNDNFDEVNKLLEEGRCYEDLAKEYGGLFEKNGRVKQIKIRGVFSQGYIADIESLKKAYPVLEQYTDEDFACLEGVSFDIIGDDVFCEKYLVGGKKLVENKVNDQKHYTKRQKDLRKASPLVPGQFKYHYDTKHFEDAYKDFEPDDEVTISVKFHGSSGIFGNIKCYKRKEDCNILQRLFYWLYKPREYRLIYASRTKIRNENVYNETPNRNYFYGQDIWGPVRDLIEPYVPKNMIVYGEIVGYVEGTTQMIQSGHDYGCKPGEWKFMPYRIVQIQRRNKRLEWDLDEVACWTDTITKILKEKGEYAAANKLITVPIIYKGKLRNLYPDLPDPEQLGCYWHIYLLDRMKRDDVFLGMEAREPLCKMNVPREGVVIRKINDITPRAWKLKSALHQDLEKKAHDKGEHDIEEES